MFLLRMSVKSRVTEVSFVAVLAFVISAVSVVFAASASSLEWVLL